MCYTHTHTHTHTHTRTHARTRVTTNLTHKNRYLPIKINVEFWQDNTLACDTLLLPDMAVSREMNLVEATLTYPNQFFFNFVST
jgi:hypothetical protein